MSQSSAGTPVRLAIEIPMQPLPVQTSKRNLTGAVVFLRSAMIFSAASASVSVSARGISTFSFTVNGSPMNSHSPIMYCSGS